MKTFLTLLALVCLVSTQTLTNQVMIRACLKVMCPNQLQACQKDAKCGPALEKCQRPCKSDLDCEEKCVSETGNEAAINTFKCGRQSQCQNDLPDIEVTQVQPNCIQVKCPIESRICDLEPKCNFAFKSCFKDCAFDESCFSSCLLKVDISQTFPLWKCVQDNQCLSKTKASQSRSFANCVKQQCTNQVIECAQDLQCNPAFLACNIQCVQDFECFESCIAENDNQVAHSLLRCTKEKSCSGLIHKKEKPMDKAEGCVQRACLSQMGACLADPSCFLAFQKCAKCDFDEVCWKECLEEKKNSVAINFRKCATENNCMEELNPRTPQPNEREENTGDPFLRCMNRECSSAQKACKEEKSCLKALMQCTKKDGESSEFDEECLQKKGQEIQLVKNWFQCSIQKDCL